MKTFTQIVGTTATNSPSTYGGSFTTLANNNSSQAVASGQALTNDQHRYLIQKYFDNERTVTLSTVGSMNLTLTVAPIAGATTATLTSVWTYITCMQLVTFSDGEQQNAQFTTGSAAISWQVPLNSGVTTAIKTVGVQNYPIPANVSKIKNDTINVGQLKYQPVFVQSIQEWDMINFLPYNSDIPNYCFIYNGTLRIFPIPSTTGNIITFNYKGRVPDFSFTDYTTGNITTMTVGSTSVTGTSTSWSTTGKYPLNTDVSFYNLYLRVDPPYGDGIWYPISRFNSDTSLTLALPVVNAPAISAGSTYTIGQMPLLQEDFHDMIVYGALRIYYSTIAKDTDKFKEFDALYKERLSLLAEYAGTKQVNVDLEDSPNVVNPNLFIYKSN